MSKFRLVGLVLATVFALPAAASPVIFHVTSSADSGPGTLRQAIIDGNALPTNDYPDILIDLGESSPIELDSVLPTITNKSLKLRGTMSTRAVISGSSGTGSMIKIDASVAINVLMEHVELMSSVSWGDGACLSLVADAGSILIQDAVFEHCVSYTGTVRGGAIYSSALYLTIEDSEFNSNSAKGTRGMGGAIYQTGGNLTVRRSLFFSNEAAPDGAQSGSWSQGGAIHASSSDLDVSDSVFRGNRSHPYYDDTVPSDYGNEGGAINTDESAVSLRRNKFLFNDATTGGGALALFHYPVGESDPFVLINNTFIGNVTTAAFPELIVGGGAVSVFDADVVLRNNSFLGNDAADTRMGNGIDVYSASLDAWNNLVGGGGQGNWCDASSTTSSGFNIIPENTCTSDTDSTTIVTTELHLQGYLLGTTLPAAPLRFFADSPAVDGGYPAAPHNGMIPRCPQLDGQGNPRYGDGDANGSTRCDIGAFEWQREASLFANDFEDRLQP